MIKLKNILMVMVLVLLLYHCNIFSNEEGGSDNPVPALTKIFPLSKVSHMPTFTLTANGNNFVKGSTIVFNGVEKETTYFTSTQLTCKIHPEDIDFSALPAESNSRLAKVYSKDVQVLVRNPPPGGGDSESHKFSVHENHTFNVLRKFFQGTASRLKTPISIAVDSADNIYLAWFEGSLGDWEIYFTSSVH